MNRLTEPDEILAMPETERDAYAAEVLPCKTYTKVGKDMTWPSYDQGDLEWQLRYGSEKQVIEARFRLASIVAAYQELIRKPQKQRNAILQSATVRAG